MRQIYLYPCFSGKGTSAKTTLLEATRLRPSNLEFKLQMQKRTSREAIMIAKTVSRDSKISKQGSTPLGRGVHETKSKNGRSRPRKPFISRVFCARRGFRDHGLRPRSRKGPDHGVGVDPETFIRGRRFSRQSTQMSNRDLNL